jgi:oxygen-independent coproporphyrinogen-3 oxidase
MEHSLPTALYLHVPFCLAKCFYCDFYSVVRAPESVSRYLDALGTELRLARHERREPLRTVYVGGGTPTVLAATELERLLSMLSRELRLSDGAEFTVETNPGTGSAEKLHTLRKHGVNRLSIGVQSFNDRLLALLGRRHKAQDALEALSQAKAAGFSNVSLDLMFGVPTQTAEDWSSDLEAALGCDVAHLSTYSLTYEENTPLARAVATGRMDAPGEEEELRMYETAIDTLTAQGYEHYEVSNFCRPGFRCRHNEVYWANEPYQGLGPSAVSCVGGERRRNVASLDDYLRMLESGRPAVDFRERLDREKRARETAMLNLRRTRGIIFDEFLASTGFDARTLFSREIREFSSSGLIESDKRGMRLTRRGLMVADTVLSELV